ncbi:MAG: ParB N-terminal domain-containing protein, partial [Gammaproteobacteria bacterium]|nr:ParB N-terminal domain-containing protein [Gammaproteobacteria bacterium]
MDEGAPGENSARTDLNPSTLVEVSITQIHPYERNPRQGRNPEYDRIKASIRTSGLDQPLVITQRPGSTDYIVHSGGNTRLLVLKELYGETNDARFSRIQCLFRPWNRESDLLLAHLRENDLRGGLIFIDKALAVFEIK